MIFVVVGTKFTKFVCVSLVFFFIRLTFLLFFL